MVNIIGLTTEDTRDRDRASKLIDLAREALPNCSVKEFGPYLLSVTPDGEKSSIAINLLRANRISVGDPRLLDSAVSLASAYEKAGEEEFTVKKEYGAIRIR